MLPVYSGASRRGGAEAFEPARDWGMGPMKSSGTAPKLVATVAFLVLVVGALAAAIWAARGPDGQVLRTADLGVQLVQDNAAVPMTAIEVASRGIDLYSATVNRRAFEIRVPETMWLTPDAEYPALQIAISEDPAIFDMVGFEADREETPFLAGGTGMAMARHGKGPLLTAGDPDRGQLGHNYIVAERFNASTVDFRAVLVPAIEPRDGDADLLAEGTAVYLVLYMNTSPDDGTSFNPGFGGDLIRKQETEFIEIRFESDGVAERPAGRGESVRLAG